MKYKIITIIALLTIPLGAVADKNDMDVADIARHLGIRKLTIESSDLPKSVSVRINHILDGKMITNAEYGNFSNEYDLVITFHAEADELVYCVYNGDTNGNASFRGKGAYGNSMSGNWVVDVDEFTYILCADYKKDADGVTVITGELKDIEDGLALVILPIPKP